MGVQVDMTFPLYGANFRKYHDRLAKIRQRKHSHLFIKQSNSSGILKKAIFIVLVMTLLSAFTFTVKNASGAAQISVQPNASTVWGTNETLTINITVSDVTDLYGWQFKLYYEPRILNGTSIIEGSFLKSAGATFSETSFNDGYNATHGCAIAFCTLKGNMSGVTGSGVLAIVSFRTKALGSSVLDLSETVLGRVDSTEIPHNVVDGAVQVVKAVHDVAIRNVILSSSQIVEGHPVEVVVSVANEGNKTENFTVTLYRNETVIAAQAVSDLTPKSNINLTFNWNTTGLPQGTTYKIKAEASKVSEETDLEDNVFIYGTVRIVQGSHDVAIKNVVPSPTIVFQGEQVNIAVVAANIGDYTESFTVTIYCGDDIIGKQAVNNLVYGHDFVLNFIWDTTGAATNTTYRFKAVSSPVLGESNLNNNNFTSASVTVYPLGLLSIKIVSLVPCNQLGEPKSTFALGTVAYFKIVVESKSFKAENLLLTINLYDAPGNAIGVVSFKGPIAPGTSTFILGTPILTTATVGVATAHANALSDWPHLGGTPYCPEIVATFQIGGS